MQFRVNRDTANLEGNMEFCLYILQGKLIGIQEGTPKKAGPVTGPPFSLSLSVGCHMIPETVIVKLIFEAKSHLLLWIVFCVTAVHKEVWN